MRRIQQYKFKRSQAKKRINIDLKLKIVTGAQSNILPVNLYKKIFPEHMTQEDKVEEGILTPSDVILTAYGGTRIPQLDKATITGTHKGKITKCSFYFTRTEGPAILGLDTCQKLNIVSINGEVKGAPSKIDRDMPIKNLTKSPARLQRLYSHDKQEMEGLSVKVYHIVNITNTKLEQIKEETSKDEELQLLTQMVIQGWPEKRHQVQSLIREYWAIHDDISVENGILMAGSRIIIPKSMQKEILDKIHQGHLGMKKCKLRAKSVVYWVGHGFIERQVQTVKRTQVKCRETKEDPRLALLSLQATPLRADMKSPTEMLNGRKYKTILPTKIQPPIHQEETRAKLAATQEQAQKYYNKHTQYLPEILGEQHVHTQDPITKTWIPAQVVSRAETPRVYIIETESASVTTPTRTTTPTADDSTNRIRQQHNDTLQTPVQSTRSTRWRPNILPPIRYR
uniref:Uncharacterized protein n=1 Tax=Octopus bimaculoides TaxID=37653 RepID=A0A0L8FP40_OCTBM